MKELWNERYSAEGYAYGINPNPFFAKELDKLKPGSILLPAEGEGRNAVYAAYKGWKVTAFDFSDKGKEKALKLANNKGVSINYFISSYDEMELIDNSFDCIGLIYAHVMDGKRHTYYSNLARALKPSGTLILEGFSKDQLKYNTGGPPKVEFLFSSEELENDFNALSSHTVEELVEKLDEGIFHSGKAAIIRFIGKK